MSTSRRAFLMQSTGLLAPAILRGAVRRVGDKPNLLFLWTDEQRADTMAAYGNTRFHVPALNRLASQSIVFDRAYVTQPVCTPSRSSVMTGLWPHQSGCVNNSIPLPAAAKVLPELVNDSAYRTGYMGKWHLGDEIFRQHGFHEWCSIEDDYIAQYSAGRDREARSDYDQFLRKRGYQPDGKNNVFTRAFATRLPVEVSKSAFLAGRAQQFMTEHRSRPWMLYVNFLEPHMPFEGPYNDLHTEEEAPLPANFPGIPDRGEPEWYRQRRATSFRTKGQVRNPAPDARTLFQRTARNYAGLCTLVDGALDRILWTLEATGQAENTIVVFTSDHGEMMGAHSMLAKQVMYEEAVRVPLLLRVPFRRQLPAHVKHPVSGIDLVPTLLDLLGREQAGEVLPGRSLIPALADPAARRENVVLEWTADVKDSGAGPSGRTIISPDGYKLVLYDTDLSMLFDHNKDPLEMHNVYGLPAYSSVQSGLRKALERWQNATNDRFKLPPGI